MAAVVFVSSVLKANAGDVLLVLAAGARLSVYVAATVGEIGFLRGIWLDGSRRLAWLEDYAASLVEHSDAPVPERLREGIRFEHVSFAYPGTERLVLEDVNLHLKPGSVVAIVGENGAGKTTLVKLLCALYRPTSGRILIDGVDLARMPPDAWRSRLSGAFQDFFQFEFRVRHSVGIGDVPRVDDLPAVTAAVDRAGAGDVVEHFASGLETQLGPTWPGGVEISFGQWQKLALARGFMRDHPLLLVLDEPTAALDAETEHALFERYAAATREPRSRQPHHDPGIAPLQHRAHGRLHRGARRRARGRIGHARSASGARRAVCRAIRHSGRSVSLIDRSLPVHAVSSGAGNEQDHHNCQVQKGEFAAALSGQTELVDKNKGRTHIDRNNQGGPARSEAEDHE